MQLLVSALVAAITTTTATVPRVDAIEIVVRDVAAERRFYTLAFGFRDLGSHSTASGRIDRLALGNERLDLARLNRTGAPIPRSARSNDPGFQHIAIIVSDMGRAWDRVRRLAIRRVSPAPQLLPKWNPAAGGISAVYFRDPEGHPLEMLHFPRGKGAPQWHAAAPLVLGIDHTAIAVADMAASIRFYEALGLTVRGHSLNYGVEQERLSGVTGARVQITGLRFVPAPGIEFLHYVSPPATKGTTPSPNDLAATRTEIVQRNASALCKRFPSAATGGGGCLVRESGRTPRGVTRSVTAARRLRPEPLVGTDERARTWRRVIESSAPDGIPAP